MGNKRTSIIWTESTEDFQKRVKECNSIADIVRSFGFAIGKAQYKTIYARIEEDQIDITHIPLGLGANKNKILDVKRKPIEDYLAVGTNIKGSILKKKLIKGNLMKDVCYECGLGNIWNNKNITLQLDHINGVRDDNRLENLRILCPNCHSQTPTFCGRHKGVKCLDCHKRIKSKSKRCQICANKILPQNSNLKFNISKEDLEKLVWEKPTSDIAKEFNVSDKAIEKRCKKYNIQKPPRGYWQKIKSQHSQVDSLMVKR